MPDNYPTDRLTECHSLDSLLEARVRRIIKLLESAPAGAGRDKLMFELGALLAGNSAIEAALAAHDSYLTGGELSWPGKPTSEDGPTPSDSRRSSPSAASAKPPADSTLNRPGSDIGSSGSPSRSPEDPEPAEIHD